MAANSSETRLLMWLEHRGLRKNPFDIWNAERDPELPNYFVDMARFDELLRATEPCLVFAQRGCGKTAQRQMLAAQCRPLNENSPWLAVPYTYTGFEEALTSAHFDSAQLQPVHHVAALLRQALQILDREIRRDPGLYATLAGAGMVSRLSAYRTRYVPSAQPYPGDGEPYRLEGLTTPELLEGFANLVQAAGLQGTLILVDGLDELPLTAGDLAQMAALLAPLLGTLRLIECPGVAWKFFLPQPLEPVLRGYRWFRSDRLRIFRIAWTPQDLEQLIGQRLTYFSIQGDRALTRLGQLCREELASRIDLDLAGQAAGVPRAALALADLFLRTHCEQPGPPDLITAVTWKTTGAQWSDRRADFIDEPLPVPHAESTTAQPATALFTEAEWQVLKIDEARGQVWLGDRDITPTIRKQDYRVLLCLYRHQQAMCDKDLLAEEAWPDATGGVTDEQIAAAIARLRKNLNQSDPLSGYIETIKGRGYRLHPSAFHANRR